MERQPPQARRFLRGAGVVGVVAAIALASIPAAATTGVSNGLVAHVRLTQVGPLPACSPDLGDCTAANIVTQFVYVQNTNDLVQPVAGSGRSATRATFPNSFVVRSVEQRIFIDGSEVTDWRFTFTPPPNANLRSWSGHWPSTVTCGAADQPCNVVGDPAVVPGENTAVFYGGWIHGSEEPNGRYVFSYVIRGTLEGEPIELTASSSPIIMTD